LLIVKHFSYNLTEGRKHVDNRIIILILFLLLSFLFVLLAIWWNRKLNPTPIYTHKFIIIIIAKFFNYVIIIIIIIIIIFIITIIIHFLVNIINK